MGWTGRAPAPDGTQSARGACQEKEHYHASRSNRSRSDRHRNPLGPQPRSGAMLVLIQVSSMKTRREASILP